MGYLFLLFAVASLATLGVLHKVADHSRCHPAAVNLFLFLVAAVVAPVVTFLSGGPGLFGHLPVTVIGLAVLCGMFASVAVLSFQHGIRYGKISTSWLVINLSTAIPAFLSVIVYDECISWRRAMGLCLTGIALLLLWLDRRREEKRINRPSCVSIERI